MELFLSVYIVNWYCKGLTWGWQFTVFFMNYLYVFSNSFSIQMNMPVSALTVFNLWVFLLFMSGKCWSETDYQWDLSWWKDLVKKVTCSLVQICQINKVTKDHDGVCSHLIWWASYMTFIFSRFHTACWYFIG